MRIGAVGDTCLAQVAKVVQVLFDLLVAAWKVQCYLLHVVQTAARTDSAADVVNPEATGFPLFAHLNEAFGRRVLRIRPETYPGDAELLKIEHVFRGWLTRAGADLDAWRDRRHLCGFHAARRPRMA